MESLKNFVASLLFLDINLFGVHLKPIFFVVLGLLGGIFKIMFGRD